MVRTASGVEPMSWRGMRDLIHVPESLIFSG
jgi:hypothetical protein